MGTSKDSEKTRARLIDVAGRLFADHGYTAVSVRDIARAAKTHLSAVNYHFHGKEALYREVLKTACSCPRLEKGRETQLQETSAGSKAHAPASIRILIEEMLTACDRDERADWQSRLVLRECLDPSAEFASLVEISRPQLEELAALLGGFGKLPATSLEARFAAFLLFAQVDALTAYAPLLKTLVPELNDHAHRGWVTDILTALMKVALATPFVSRPRSVPKKLARTMKKLPLRRKTI